MSDPRDLETAARRGPAPHGDGSPLIAIVLAGLPGVGKSALARRLAHRLDCPHLDKDQVRQALFGPRWVAFDRSQDDLCVDVMLRVVADHAWRGAVRAVVLDGRTYARAADLRRTRRELADLGTRAFVVELSCPPTEARRRLAEDARAGRHPAADRGPGLYDAVAARAEPIHAPDLSLDSGRHAPEALAEQVLEALPLIER